MYEAERAKEAEVTTTEAEVAATGETQPALPTAAAAVGEETAQDVAVRAAEVSLMTLDRIEAAAAKLEADIAAARSEQARLQAGAAKAAADAIKAAQAAWTSAGSAEESSQRARVSARVVFGYLIIAAILVVIQLFIVLIFATSAH
jgi:t-SNARE complex subunit (syntaxin)